MRASIKAKNRRYQKYYGSPIEMVGTPSSTIIFPEDPDADSTPEEALVPWKSLASAALALALLLIPGCGSKSPSQRAGTDQEIARNILWRFHQDPGKRFQDVRVTCEDLQITLEGRVADAKAAGDAVQIALNESRGSKVDSRLEVRLR